MDNQLNFNAIMAWTAFGAQDYMGLAKHGSDVYNYFVHNPDEILKLDNPLLIGKVFQICLGFNEPNEDIQEVRAENAFLCFAQAMESDKAKIRDEALARLMILLIRDQKHLKNKVEHACQNENYNSFSFIGVMGDGFPNDMPLATNTKMLFTAYYLYNIITDKTNVINEFVSSIEKNAYINVESHIIDNCNQLCNTTSDRKIELGKIVFDKIIERLQKDVALYSDNV